MRAVFGSSTRFALLPPVKGSVGWFKRKKTEGTEVGTGRAVPTPRSRFPLSSQALLCDPPNTSTQLHPRADDPPSCHRRRRANNHFGGMDNARAHTPGPSPCAVAASEATKHTQRPGQKNLAEILLIQPRAMRASNTSDDTRLPACIMRIRLAVERFHSGVLWLKRMRYA